MRIIVVSNLYRPQATPRAIRWSAVAEHWVAAGHEVHVVASRLPELPRRERLDGVNVWRVGGGFSERIRSRLCGPAAARCPLEEPLLARLRQSVAFRGRPADAQAACDVLITSSLPFSAHLVGLRMKRLFPQVPWLADVGDPFSFMDTPVNNRRLYRRLNAAFDRRVFQRADALSVTTEPTRQIYIERHGGEPRPVRVIPPLVRMSSNEASTRAVFPDDGRIRLVYVGTLYGDIRSPRPERDRAAQTDQAPSPGSSLQKGR